MTDAAKPAADGESRSSSDSQLGNRNDQRGDATLAAGLWLRCDSEFRTRGKGCGTLRKTDPQLYYGLGSVQVSFSH
jgi:hypothetical protein